MTGLRDVEYSELARQVEQVEKLIEESGGKVGYLLKAFVQNAKSRLEEIRGDERKGETEKKEEKTREAAAVAALVEREHQLNAEEKQEYGEFLKQDFFTRADFSRLDKFYAKTWDKLSDDGKAQMSQRVWEGIRHNEYSFDELPENVRKKESEWIYLQVTEKKPAAPGLENVPPQDKADFIRAYEAKDEKAVGDVLSRKGFSQNIYSEKSASRGEADSPDKIQSDETQNKSEGAPAPKQGNENMNTSIAMLDAAPVSPTELGTSGGLRSR